ncbi:FecR domain-containing protein [Caulobacter sp. 73W]|uniref:FecR domain-containing protein n=1 Tax=Caulobacter sp. 73W TaxID=3161137 RepID=A0AB39KQV5_9CAUL
MSDPKGETRAEKEAAAWFTRLSAPKVRNRDLDAFYRWRRLPQNAAAYSRVEGVFTTVQDLAGDPDIDAAAIEALNRHAQSRHRRPVWRDPRAVTAGIMVTAVALAAVIVTTSLGRTYETEVGERRIIRLSDGSTLQLNTDSRVRVRLGKARRLIDLERGQAFFDVAHDPSRPFTVDAGGVDVTALGTKFDVRRDANGAYVTLVQGRVVVRREADHYDAITLDPGQGATAEQNGPPRLLATDVQAATSWTQGRLVFHDTPLFAAVAEVNRYSDRKLTLGDGVDPQARINGVFDAGDVAAFATAAADVLEVSARPTPHGLELRATR